MARYFNLTDVRYVASLPKNQQSDFIEDVYVDLPDVIKAFRESLTLVNEGLTDFQIRKKIG